MQVPIEGRAGGEALALVVDLAAEPDVDLGRERLRQSFLDLNPALLGGDVFEDNNGSTVVRVQHLLLVVLGLGLEARQRGVGGPPHRGACVLELQLGVLQGGDNVLRGAAQSLHLVATQDQTHLQPTLLVARDLLAKKPVALQVLVGKVVLDLLADDRGVRRLVRDLRSLGLRLLGLDRGRLGALGLGLYGLGLLGLGLLTLGRIRHVRHLEVAVVGLMALGLPTDRWL
mmetsp:Transcript_143321/g.458042  ORF Transcript_143321/g.458042 Transcript_143321/m.458042 type:complete len:229 (+) Transcript_143321:772-1458(+)